MAGIVEAIFSDTFSWKKILIRISPKSVPNGPINNSKLVLVQVMAQCRKGAILFVDAYMRWYDIS